MFYTTVQTRYKSTNTNTSVQTRYKSTNTNTTVQTRYKSTNNYKHIYYTLRFPYKQSDNIFNINSMMRWTKNVIKMKKQKICYMDTKSIKHIVTVCQLSQLSLNG